MQLSYRIAYDVAGMIIITLLFVMFHTQYQAREGRNYFFKRFLLCGIICGIFDFITVFSITYAAHIPVALNTLLVTLYHVSFSLFAFAGTHYVYVCQGCEAIGGKIADVLATTLYAIVLMANCYYGFFYKFTESGFVKGKYYICYCLLTVWFLLHAAFVLCAIRKRIAKKEYFIYTAFVLIPLFFGFLQGLFLPETRLVFFAGTMSALLMFASLETEDYRALTITLKKLEESRENEIRANNAKSAFLAKMSHEIRTPINAILGMNTMILRDSRDSNIRNYSQNIENSGKNLLSLINNILDFSKIESGKMELVEVEYHLLSIINDCYHLIFLRAQEKGLELEVNMPAEISNYILYGDEVRIRQIITNLLTNAVKYTAEGKITMDVSGEVDEDIFVLNVSVKDTGSGIAEENQTKLFNAYERVDEKANRFIEGTGLGLQIASSFVSMMGGSIEVESKQGVGSTFTMRIPQRIVGISTEETVEPDGSLRGLKDRGERDFIAPEAHILVVDDVDMNIKVIQGFLKPSKIKIDTAKSGAECVATIGFNNYDMVFLDHMMPGMDGIETFNVIKEKMGDALPPIIMMTANAIMGAKEEYLKTGFADYISKPVMIDELKGIVLKYLPKDKIIIVEKDVSAMAKDEASWIEKVDFLDTSAGLDYCAGDMDFYKEMIKEFVEGNRMPDMQTYFSMADWDNYRIQVHAVKSTAKSIGADDLSEKARYLEMAARENRIQDIRQRHGLCMMAYGKLLDQLKHVFEIY